jgi:hypothetical protein
MLRFPPFLAASACAVLVLLLASSGCTQPREVLGQAYVAPATLNVRSQLALKSGAVTTLKHGDLVGIVDVQRRMVKIRSKAGFEGWADSLSLLSIEQMEQLRRERKAALLLPPEGSATAFEAMNIHIAPFRTAAAFAQIPEGGSVSILGRKVTPKLSLPARAPSLMFERAQAPNRKQHKEPGIRLNMRVPPKPPAPKAPANWLELSKERIDGKTAGSQRKVEVAKVPETPQKPVVLDDWTLVRTKADEVGWVLTRNLLMSIPDEVAQYAEGKHITSFFDLGTVPDEVKGPKHHWLWTTGPMLLPYDFDSWRVFLWNRRKHRYETSYRQHDLEGYFPVHVEAAATGAAFQLVTKDDDGKFRRRSYSFDGSRVHLTGAEDYTPGAPPKPAVTGSIDTGKLQTKLKASGWFNRQWTALKQRFSKK